MTAQISVFENRGRDIAPFLAIAAQLLDEGEELFLKLHTKRSPHRPDGNMWRRRIVDRLLPVRGGNIFINLFKNNPEVGLAVPVEELVPLEAFWGANETTTRSLSSRLGLAIGDPSQTHFPSGSMFWGRVEALRPLFDLPDLSHEFEAESGQLDGTVAHAVERLFVVCARSQGMTVVTLPLPRSGKGQRESQTSTSSWAQAESQTRER